MYFNTLAIVIKKTKLSDTDIILTLFTKKAGKVTVISKGARNPKSKLSSASHPFIYGDFMLSMGSKWNRINSVEIEESFYKLREDLVRLAYASYIVELTSHVILENSPNIRLFNLLYEALSVLNNKNTDFELLKISYELKMMSIIGYKMNINSCVNCGKTDNIKWYISPIEGGLICEDCKRNFNELIYSGKNAHKVINFILTNDISTVLNTSINKRYIVLIGKILSLFIFHHLGHKKFKSLDFLNTIK
ncbi:DNA repair protein RecO [Helicovermis profundi]|uniref:DNA repair protein RecO n=1 Tax=Helicovermis profundi TaxID=3065157 RepID=A0AAU9E6D0_9FIRM|nr:DNA repair protein RecO [Clostridia bacterium S502]